MTATWSDPSAQIAADYPARASSVRQIQENITALAEGASGAPAITRAALVALGYVGLLNGTLDPAPTSYGTVTSYASSVSGGGATVSSGEVTVPRAGIYLVAWSATLNRGNADDVRARIQVNGVNVMAEYSFDSDGDHPVSQSFLLSLAANDVVRVQGRVQALLANGSLTRVCLTVQEQG